MLLLTKYEQQSGAPQKGALFYDIGTVRFGVSQGLVLSKKYSRNSDKIFRILKISPDFQIVFLSKYSEENFQKFVQPAAPKYFV